MVEGEIFRAAPPPPILTDDDPQWYVLRTEWQREGLVAEIAADMNIESFLPLEEREVRHARRTTTKVYPILSRYILTKFALNSSRWTELGTARGAEGFLGLRLWDDGRMRPQAVRSHEVDGLIATSRLIDLEKEKKPEIFPQLTPGTLVRVRVGIFVNFTGAVLHDRGGRVMLRLDKQFGGGQMKIARESVHVRG